MSTDWTVQVTDIVGDDIGHRAGSAGDRTTAVLAMFAAAHDCVDDAGDTTPIYVLALDDTMVGFVSTGRPAAGYPPEHQQVHTQLRDLQTRVLTTALSCN